jgi:hypothetical protein
MGIDTDTEKSPKYLLPFVWDKLGGDRFQPNQTVFRIARKNSIIVEIPDMAGEQPKPHIVYHILDNN